MSAQSTSVSILHALIDLYSFSLVVKTYYFLKILVNISPFQNLNLVVLSKLIDKQSINKAVRGSLT